MKNNLPDQPAVSVGVRVQRPVRRFRDLPLGARIRNLSGGSVWVILQREGCGLVAKWEGIDGPIAGQSICSQAETEAECATVEVEVVDLMYYGSIVRAIPVFIMPVISAERPSANIK
jgi:hypothetical protein